MNEDMLKRLALLSALKNGEDASDEESNTEYELCIMSVQEAATLIDMKGGTGSAQFSRQVAAHVTQPENHVYGNADDYHNLVARFLQFGDYYTALQICNFALKRFPYSVDLLANAIQAAGQAGLFEVGEAYINQAKKIDMKYWNWRLFLFIIVYYQSLLNSCAPDTIGQVYERAVKISKDYQFYLPMDERGYNKEAELLLFANERAKAKQVLSRAIFDKIQIDGESVNLIAAQCCVTMLDDILDDSEEYDLIIKVARKGIKNTAQEQPSSRIGYFVYRSALAKDALVVKEEYQNRAKIEEALTEYQCAYDLNQSMSYAKTISERYAILCQNAKSPIVDMPLKKRPLVFTESAKGN